MTANETIMTRTIEKLNSIYDFATRYENPAIFYNLKPRAQVTEAKKAVKELYCEMIGASELGINILESLNDAEGAKKVFHERCVLNRKFEQLQNSIKSVGKGLEKSL